MRWSKTVTMTEAHAEGEIGRIVTSGILDIPGTSMAQKLAYMNSRGDALRRFLVQEPRGFAQMSTVLMPQPTLEYADAGFIVLQGDKAHAMSGSNCICAATVLLETGLVEMREPVTEIILDTASGPVTARAECKNGKCERVEVEMPPCYVHELDAQVQIEGIGPVTLSIAYGGIFYALLDPAPLGLEIKPESARKLVDAGMRIQREVNRKMDIRHPEIDGLTGLSYLMFISRDDDGGLRSATIMPPGRIDRSPCGTGNSARCALMRARNEISPGDSYTARSIIDSEFQVKLLKDTRIGGKPAVVPSISGRGWIHGMHQIGIDPSDPYQQGYMVSDCWGDAFDLLNPSTAD